MGVSDAPKVSGAPKAPKSGPAARDFGGQCWAEGGFARFMAVGSGGDTPAVSPQGDNPAAAPVLPQPALISLCVWV